MYDYLKIWIEDIDQINQVLENPILFFKGSYYTRGGEVLSYPLKCEWNKIFSFELKSATRLQITGSLHKYWNKGTNENDFRHSDVTQAITKFCKEFNIDPRACSIHNLEYGINIKPSINASTIIDQIICYKNSLPLRPYEGRNEDFFIEFEKDGYYFKIYDKGKQYNMIKAKEGIIQNEWDNILRIEKKAMTADQLKKANIITLSDLMEIEPMQVLGMELAQLSNFIILNDPTVNVKKLPAKDKIIYNRLRYSEEWTKFKGAKTSTQKRHEQRFKKIVNENGTYNIYSYLSWLINDKIYQLTNPNKSLSISKYNKGTAQTLLHNNAG